MIIRVAICKRLPASVGAFDYSVPKNLENKIQVGMGIQVPFRSRIVIGVVTHIQPKAYQSPVIVKPLVNFIYNEPLLTAVQVQIMLWLAATSYSSCHTVAHALLPHKPKKAEWKFPPIAKKNTPRSEASSQVRVFSSAIQLFSSIVERLSSSPKNAQTVCLVPDRQTAFFLSSLLKKHSVHAEIIDSTLSQGKKFLLWQNIRGGMPGVFIGTRSMLLFPFTPTHMYVVREDDVAYQFIEQHPDIDAVEFARHIAQLHHVSVDSFTVTPRLDTIKEIKDKKIQLHLPTHKPDITSHVIPLHSLTPRRQALVPEDLIDFLKNASGSSFISYNRKGYANQQQCADCGWRIPCPQCHEDSFIKWHTQKNGFCIKCALDIKAPGSCQKCGGAIFKTHQPGISQIASYLKKMLPEKRIYTLQKSGETLQADPAQIVVGTSFALSQILWHKIQTVIILDADMQLSFPDFRVEERFLQRMRWIRSRLPKKSHFFIITKQQSRSLFSAISSESWYSWIESELTERKRFLLPPYSDLVLVKYNSLHNLEDIKKKISVAAKKTQHRVTFMHIEYKRRERLLFRIHHPHLNSFNEMLCKELPECVFSPSPLDLS